MVVTEKRNRKVSKQRLLGESWRPFGSLLAERSLNQQASNRPAVNFTRQLAPHLSEWLVRDSRGSHLEPLQVLDAWYSQSLAVKEYVLVATMVSHSPVVHEINRTC